MTRITNSARAARAALGLTLALALAACGSGPDADDVSTEAPTLASDTIDADTFGCIRDMTAVDRFFVSNLDGDLDTTVAVAASEDGGTFPVGSVVQLVPTEVMVKRAEGFNPASNDWEFFDLTISAEGTEIRTRGAEVVNRFGNSCLDCHAQAKPEFDMICSTDHGCDPIPVTDVMISALQKTDPRCEAPLELTTEEAEGLKILQEAFS